MSKSLITNVRKLRRKKYRLQTGQFIAEGLRVVEQIIGNSLLQIDYLVFDESLRLWEGTSFKTFNPQVEHLKVDKKQFAEISDTESPQGVLAVCKMPEAIDLSFLRQQDGCIVALNRIQDPGNSGTILRTAAWFGACGMLCDEGTADLFHPKVVRSTAGATGSVPWWTGNLESALTELESSGWKTYLLDAGRESFRLNEVNPHSKSIVIIGNEAGGLDESLKKSHRTLIRIPGREGASVESLNASVALSIALYEFIKI